MPDRDYCCDAMRNAVDGWEDKCRHHVHAHECPDALISVHADGAHGIVIHDGGSSHVEINYCPWCGEETEESGSSVDRESMVDSILRSEPNVDRRLLDEMRTHEVRAVFLFLFEVALHDAWHEKYPTDRN